MVFTNVINPRSHVSRKSEYRKTVIKRGATIGANATILCGATLGRYAFVGAGAVITGNLPDYALAYGNPARVRGWMCQCGVKLAFESHEGSAELATCRVCNTSYVKVGDLVKPTDSELTV
jgi:UDP-2-acetamido-3-amino-2,3-dideoxy-glucuronate N-acetyltransferase